MTPSPVLTLHTSETTQEHWLRVGRPSRFRPPFHLFIIPMLWKTQSGAGPDDPFQYPAENALPPTPPP